MITVLSQNLIFWCCQKIAEKKKIAASLLLLLQSPSSIFSSDLEEITIFYQFCYTVEKKCLFLKATVANILTN